MPDDPVSPSAAPGQETRDRGAGQGVDVRLAAATATRTRSAPQVALAVLALASLVVVTGYADPALLALVVALAGGIVAWGWAGLLGLPSPRGTAAVLYLTTAAAVLSVASVTGDPWLRWLPVAVAVSVISGFVHQLARRDGRPRLVRSLCSTVLAVAVLTSGVCLVPLAFVGQGPALLTAAMAAVAAAALSDLAGRRPGMGPWLVPLGMAAGGLTAVGVALLTGLHWAPLLLLGVAAAAVSHALRSVLGLLPTMAHARPRLVCAASAVLVSGVLPYVVARIFFLPAA